MIELFTGTPGSGKSLHLAEKIHYRLLFDKPVIANFDIQHKKKKNFIYKQNDDLTVDFLVKYAKSYWKGKRVKEDEILLCIDEAQLIFNAREWSKQGRSDWNSFFTQHRKLGYKIILVAQFDGMIDKQIRSLIEYQYIHRKVSNFGVFGKIMSLIALGKLFIAVQIWYPMSEKVGSEFFTAKKKYYSMYDTFLMLDETSIDDFELVGGERGTP